MSTFKKISRILIIVLASSYFIISCKNNQPCENLNYLLERDVPKFISKLQSLSQDSMQIAFIEMNDILNYAQKAIPTSPGTLEASSLVEEGRTILDGQLILLTSPLLPHSDKNEFGISLIAYPSTDHSILKIAEPFLAHHQRKDSTNKPTWAINGWLLEINDNSLRFHATSNKSIYDLLQDSPLETDD
jgi:hypothetical protein